MTDRHEISLKAEDSENFLKKLIKEATDRKIPKVDWLTEQLTILERKHGISANEYLEFGSTGTIEYFETAAGSHYVGEKNWNGAHGKGIWFFKNGHIDIS